MMLAAAGIFLAARRNRKPTAKSYVQDGLIAMWDGIENAGWGVHDAEAMGWKDLAGTNDLVRYGCVIGDNYVQSQSANDRMTGALVYSASDVQTIEFVSQSVRQTVGLVFNIIYGDRFIGFRTDGSKLFFENNGYNFSITGVTNPQSYSFKYAVPNEVVVNGMSVSSSITGGSFGTKNFGFSVYSGYPFIGKLYSVRLYNRALSSEEVAANYAVDKARFNLPQGGN